MTQPAGDADAMTQARARNLLIRKVRDQLKGHRLEIRELARQLVISSPGHPEQGRIYLSYTTGAVSHRRTVWQYLGHFTGHSSDPTPDDPTVDLDTIITTLTQPGEDGAQ